MKEASWRKKPSVVPAARAPAGVPFTVHNAGKRELSLVFQPGGDVVKVPVGATAHLELDAVPADVEARADQLTFQAVLGGSRIEARAEPTPAANA